LQRLLQDFPISGELPQTSINVKSHINVILNFLLS